MPILQIDRYPCAWPADWARTKPSSRRNSNYGVSLAQAYKHLATELRLSRSKEVVISTNVPTRRDGIPYTTVAEPDDPAVAVYWVDRFGKHRVIACDQWKRVRENMRAVGLAVAALRQIDRSGATQVIERVYSGFLALAADNQVRTWREVFGMPSDWNPTDAELMLKWRALILERHPDHGGAHERWVETMRAFGEAREELARRA